MQNNAMQTLFLTQHLCITPEAKDTIKNILCKASLSLSSFFFLASTQNFNF